METKSKSVPDDIRNAVRIILAVHLMPQVRQEYAAVQNIAAEQVDTMSVKDILDDQSFEKRLSKGSKDVYKCTKNVYMLMKDGEDDYKQFMNSFENKVWTPYATMPFFQPSFKEFNPVRQKYWDSKSNKLRKLPDVMENERRANNPAAPVSLVNNVTAYVFDDVLDSLMGNTKEEFKKTAAFQELKTPKLKTSKDFALHMIDSAHADCYKAFEAFCKDKGEAYHHQFECLVLLNKTLKHKDNFEAFMSHFHNAQKYIIKNRIGSDELRQKVTKYHDDHWDSNTKAARTLPKHVKC